MIHDDDLWHAVSPTCNGACWCVTTTVKNIRLHVTAPTRRSAGVLAREYCARFVAGSGTRPRVIHIANCKEEKWATSKS